MDPVKNPYTPNAGSRPLRLTSTRSAGGPSLHLCVGTTRAQLLRQSESPASAGLSCAEEDSNLHGEISPQGPQPCSSTVRIDLCVHSSPDRPRDGTHRTYRTMHLLPWMWLFGHFHGKEQRRLLQGRLSHSYVGSSGPFSTLARMGSPRSRGVQVAPYRPVR